MFCTRYWIFLLACLPFPKAPPYIVLLFIISMAVHHKPCAYCSLLLTMLLVATCSRDIASSDISPLSIASSDIGNCTIEPLLLSQKAARVSANGTYEPHRRCWCDANGGRMLDPFPADGPVFSRMEVAKGNETKIERAIDAVKKARGGKRKSELRLASSRKPSSGLDRFLSPLWFLLPSTPKQLPIPPVLLPTDPAPLPACARPIRQITSSTPLIYTYFLRHVPYFDSLLLRLSRRLSGPTGVPIHYRLFSGVRNKLEAIDWDTPREWSYRGLGVRVVLGSKKVPPLPKLPQKKQQR